VPARQIIAAIVVAQKHDRDAIDIRTMVNAGIILKM
jgi:hypothetical protein